jgi:hypothetical protein
MDEALKSASRLVASRRQDSRLTSGSEFVSP